MWPTTSYRRSRYQDLDDTSDAPIIKLRQPPSVARHQGPRERHPHRALSERTQGPLPYRRHAYNLLNLPKRVQASLVSRIKVMAKSTSRRSDSAGRQDRGQGRRSQRGHPCLRHSHGFRRKGGAEASGQIGHDLKLADLGLEEKRSGVFNKLIKSPDHPRHGTHGKR